MNVLVHGLELRRAVITEIGTDDQGFWRHLVLELSFVPNVGTADEVGMTTEELGVLNTMKVRDTKMAKYIASLPSNERLEAIDEWDSINLSKEEEPEDEAE